MIKNLCTPALLYVGFSLTQIIIDVFKGFFNIAFAKIIIMIMFTIILNLLCQKGLGIISWIVVFLPFIFMTLITTFILVAFGVDMYN